MLEKYVLLKWVSISENTIEKHFVYNVFSQKEKGKLIWEELTMLHQELTVGVFAITYLFGVNQTIRSS